VHQPPQGGAELAGADQHRLLTALLGLLVPPVCVACRGPAAAGDPLCRECRVALPWLGPDVCARCALPRPCGRRCPGRPLAFDRAWAPVAYAGPSRALVRALKERGALPVVGVMAAQITATAPEALLAGAVAVPVPADPLRHRLRGLDHAARLGHELAVRCGLPVAGALRRRASRTGRQAHAGRSVRLAAGRLPVEVRARTVPEIALLVDDVHTTGATLHACAVALRAAGTREVRALTYARTLP
jgi:predicted amidophosphoribosyltransferase